MKSCWPPANPVPEAQGSNGKEGCLAEEEWSQDGPREEGAWRVAGPRAGPVCTDTSLAPECKLLSCTGDKGGVLDETRTGSEGRTGASPMAELCRERPNPPLGEGTRAGGSGSEGESSPPPKPVGE
mmetsp:Transcript_17993/g.47085  ORF Transcript_17993/g.47085 Transcript_17993/m.47085 type:complete len:126 (-) Transcript_17993:837-1214(-)